MPEAIQARLQSAKEGRKNESVETPANAVAKQGIESELKKAGVKWRALREIECGNLALQEVDIAKSAYEARMICQIQRDTERAEHLLDRYKARSLQTTDTSKSP
jgi:hypothetical protein